jgi:hypothetical protein
VQYVNRKCTTIPPATSPEWTHIPPADVTAFNDSYAFWYTAYAPTRVPHLPAETLAKNQAKTATKSAIRLFVNRFLRYAPVTDAEKLEMGIPIKDTTPTPRPKPPTRPEFRLKSGDSRLVAVHFKDEGSENKARPAGCDGAVVYWLVADAPVTDPKKLTSSALATRTPFIIEFEEADRGKFVSVALCWQNKKGWKGTTTEVQNTVVS